MTPSPAVPSPRAVLVGGLVWLAVALAIGATGVLALLPPPGPQIIILALTITAVLASTRIPGVRGWVDNLPLRWLVGAHVVRLVGVAFLVLAASGALSPLFARRAGWGDIAAAIGALVLVSSGLPRSSLHRWTYLAWNTFGLLDLMLAVGTAATVVWHQDVPGMAPLMRLPLSLVPLLVVPWMVASHIAIYRRLGASGPRS